MVKTNSTILYILAAAWGCALIVSPVSVFAQSDAAQQEKDLDEKKRIYGIKHPWENTQPYGTQYVPPSHGPETAPEIDSNKSLDTSKKETSKSNKSSKAKTKSHPGKAHKSGSITGTAKSHKHPAIPGH